MQDLRQTIDLLLKLKFAGTSFVDIFLFMLAPMPMTALFESYRKTLRFDGNLSVIAYTRLTDEDRETITRYPEIFAAYHYYDTPTSAEISCFARTISRPYADVAQHAAHSLSRSELEVPRSVSRAAFRAANHHIGALSCRRAICERIQLCYGCPSTVRLRRPSRAPDAQERGGHKPHPTISGQTKRCY